MIAASGRSLGRGAGSERLTTAMTIVSTVRPAASGQLRMTCPGQSSSLIMHILHVCRSPTITVATADTTTNTASFNGF
jgi:hypothetical protein